MKHIIVKSSQISEKDFGFIKVKQLLNQEDIPNISFALIEIDGKNKKVINRSSDALYFVLEGTGSFDINNEEVAVEKGDLIFIPKGSAYFDKGKMTLISLNNPRFDIAKVDYLD